MIQPERQEELEAIATEIFEALACERYEPSERGAGWAPTDKGHEAVIDILRRCKVRTSPAERRKAALAYRAANAQKVAARLLGKRIVVSRCKHCDDLVTIDRGHVFWRTEHGGDTCQIRKIRGDRYWCHEVVG